MTQIPYDWQHLTQRARNMSQAALADGICSVSYLSKIENNQTQTSLEIIDLLFKALDIDFIQDPHHIEPFHQHYTDYLKHRFLNHYDQYHDLEDTLKNSATKLLFSPKAFEANLILAHLNDDLEHFESLKIYESQLSERDHFNYTVLKSLSHFNHHGDIHVIEKLSPLRYLDENGFVSFFIATIYNHCGDYLSVVSAGMQAYERASSYGPS